MFKYFNDEWNKEQDRDNDVDLPRMEKRIEGSNAGEEQEKI